MMFKENEVFRTLHRVSKEVCWEMRISREKLWRAGPSKSLASAVATSFTVNLFTADKSQAAKIKYTFNNITSEIKE